MKEYLRRSVLCLATAAAACGGSAEREYDLVILNGRVMDPETQFDAVANVGIVDGQNRGDHRCASRGCPGDRRRRHGGRTRLHRHALPLSNAGRLFPRVARRVDQQHGFRDGLCGILYGGMVQGARRCDPGQLWLRGQPRVCPRDVHRRVGRRRLPDKWPHSRFDNPGENWLERRRARPWNRATRFSKRLTRACRLAPPASAAPWAT